MSVAADAEDKTEKSPVTPGSLAPARELYGFMLLDRGMAKEALADLYHQTGRDALAIDLYNQLTDHPTEAKAIVGKDVKTGDEIVRKVSDTEPFCSRACVSFNES